MISTAPTVLAAHANQSADAFNQLIRRHHLWGLWEQEEGTPPNPFPKTEAYMWHASVLKPLIEQAGKVIPIGNERRAMQLFNPGFEGRFATTSTLVGAVQVLLAGESARAHRHSASAVRFMTHGTGAYTRVDGERVYMNEGDLVLTPNWTWHDHRNDSDEPVVWMDGLDVALANYLQTMFFELHPERTAPDLLPPGQSMKLHGHANLKPTWVPERRSHSPLLLYSWTQTRDALAALRNEAGSPTDGVALEFTHPQTGGPVFPTMSCWIQLIRPGERLKAHRHTGTAVYYAFKGSGQTIIEGQRFDWTKGSFLALPPWAWHEHANTSDEDVVLFSIQDTPLITAMGWYREEQLLENDGHQRVTSTFQVEAS